jgi:hypothetical protein
MPNYGAAGQGAISGAGAGSALGPWGAAAGGIIGGLGGLFSGDNDAAAMRALQQVNEQAPGLDNQDPELKKRQLEALQMMWETAKAGGMDPQAKAALQQAQASSAAAERGARGAIVQNAQARGLGGSGAELAASLANQQGSAQRNALAGGQAAGDARTRALQAMMQTQQGTGQVRGQDLNESQARSQIEQFNARQRLQKAGMVTGQYGQQGQQQRGNIAGLGAGAGAILDFATRNRKPASGYNSGNLDNSTDGGGWYD